MRELLGIDKSSADHMLSSLLTSKLCYVYQILEDAGIPFLDGIDKIELPEPVTHDSFEQASVLPIRPLAPTCELPTDSGVEYGQVLNNVVNAVRDHSWARSEAPHQHISRTQAFGVEDEATIFARIGAAGELFVSFAFHPMKTQLRPA